MTVEKTCLMSSFAFSQFPEEYVPRVFCSYFAARFNKKTVYLGFCDTVVGRDIYYDRIRPVTYPGTEVILMYSSIDSPDSLKNISEKWTPGGHLK